LDSNVATVSLTIRPMNHAPVAANDSFATDEDTALTVTAPGGLVTDDRNGDGNGKTAVVVTGPSHGTLTLNANGSFTYTPAANFNGSDSFTYKANDGLLDSNVATVGLTIRPVNDAPLAVNDTFATDEDTALTITPPGVLGNDTDVDGNSLTAAVVTGPGHGTLTLSAEEGTTDTPAATFNGSHSFTPKASNRLPYTTLFRAGLTIRPVNDAPLAVNDTFATDEDTALTITAPGVLGNDTDVDSPALTAVVVTGPSHGTLALDADGGFTYTPAANFNGSDSFTYKANDGQADSNVATVALTISPVNDAPVAAN